MRAFLFLTTVNFAWLLMSAPACSQQPELEDDTPRPIVALTPEHQCDLRTADPKLLAMRVDGTQCVVATDCTTIRYDLRSTPPGTDKGVGSLCS